MRSYAAVVFVSMLSVAVVSGQCTNTYSGITQGTILTGATTEHTDDFHEGSTYLRVFPSTFLEISPKKSQKQGKRGEWTREHNNASQSGHGVLQIGSHGVIQIGYRCAGIKKPET
jgi:hypothetical protein